MACTQVGFLKGLMELRLLHFGELEDQMELSTLTRLQVLLQSFTHVIVETVLLYSQSHQA